MTDTYRADLNWTTGHEGGISNHPSDPGGFTVKGVARNKHPDETNLWSRVTQLYDSEGQQAVLDDEEVNAHIENIYSAEYYLPLNCSRMPPRLRRKAFDTAVNVGRRRLARWVQRTINLADRGSDRKPLLVDGGIGDKTIAALDRYASEDEFLTKQIAGFQMTHYQTLCEKAQKFEAFLRGWTNRAFDGVLGPMNAMDHALADLVTIEDSEASLITGHTVGPLLEPAWG